jgi:hypothetical protein
VKTAGCFPVLVSCLLIAQAARAATRDVRAPLVILTAQGSKDTETTAFISSLRALAAEIGIVVSTEEVATLQEVRDAMLAEARGQRKPCLVAWISRENHLRRIHLFDPWSNQLRTRTIEVGASATANAESLALILRAELLAYFHEPVAAPSPVSPRPPPPAEPPPSEPPLPESRLAEPPLPESTLPEPSPSESPPPEPSPSESPPPEPSPSESPPPEPSPSESPPHPLPARGARWAASASYALGTFLRGQSLLQGAQLGLQHMWTHLRIGVGYGLFPGQNVPGQDTAITVRRHPVALDVGYASREHHRLRWVAETVLIGDWVSRQTSRAKLPLSAQPDAVHLLVGLGVRGRQELRLFRSLALALALGAEVPLNPIKFQIARGTRTETVASLAPVRFCIEVGIKVSAF